MHEEFQSHIDIYQLCSFYGFHTAARSCRNIAAYGLILTVGIAMEQMI
jgi:hypothetical protein